MQLEDFRVVLLVAVFALNEKHPRRAIVFYAFCAALPIFLVGIIVLAVTFL